jgi:hypothetical protein
VKPKSLARACPSSNPTPFESDKDLPGNIDVGDPRKRPIRNLPSDAIGCTGLVEHPTMLRMKTINNPYGIFLVIIYPLRNPLLFIKSWIHPTLKI